MILAASSLGAGTIGFLVVLVLVVGSVFLFRSMTRHLRKVPKSFDEPPQRPSPDNDPRGSTSGDGQGRPPK